MPVNNAQRAHVSSLLGFARVFQTCLNRLPASKECFKAQSAAAVLERALEELEGALE